MATSSASVPPFAMGTAKEIWEAANSFNSTYFEYRARQRNEDQQWHFTFRIPRDFNRLTSLSVVFAAEADFSGAEVELLSTYGAEAEAVNNTSESQTILNVSATQDTWELFDISGVFTALKRNDYCGFEFDQTDFTGGSRLLGVYGTYE